MIYSAALLQQVSYMYVIPLSVDLASCGPIAPGYVYDSVIKTITVNVQNKILVNILGLMSYCIKIFIAKNLYCLSI